MKSIFTFRQFQKLRSVSISERSKWADYLFLPLKSLLFVLLLFISSNSFAQTFPPASSCTSKDLILVSAELNNGDICGSCTPGTQITNRHLIGYINNKTGSTRTSFAFWGTLVLTDPDGTIHTRSITRCAGPIPKNNITGIDFDTVRYTCGQSLKIINLYLAWTDASPGSVCPLNSATINPKCGTLPSITVVAGLNADIDTTNATCTSGGTISVSPYGGTAPYSVTVNSVTKTVSAGGTATFSNLPASTTPYTISITDATLPTHCTNNSHTRTINSAAAVTANAGNDFTKTCSTNPNGAQIGETAVSGFTYSWSPTAGLSDATAANPTANPSSTTTYTVTKTSTSTGCSGTDAVTVTVNTTPPTANAGSDVTLNCTTKSTTLGASGGISYSWSPSAGLSATNIANPTATSTSTTTYTVTVTGSNGCTASDDVVVTVDNTQPTANAGSDATLNCTTTSTTLGASGGVSYSWSPSAGLSATNIANPTATPTSTTTYTVTVTGANGCTATDNVKVTVDNTKPTANAGNDVTLNCTTGSTTLGASGGVSYSWSPATGLSATNIANPTATPTSTTTYTVTVTGSNGCTATDDVTVTVSTTPPSAPAICVTQPSLCGPTTGSVTIKSPLGTDYSYSIDNGTTWQSSTNFTGLAAGSVTGIKVKQTSTGCVSSAVSCDASDCSSPQTPLSMTQPSTKISSDQTTVKAYPNPFNNQVRFVVNAGHAGNGTLEVFNVLGQKVKTVYHGYVPAGVNNFDLNLPGQKNANLIYRFILDNKLVTGKLIQLNQ
ncbi:T9SS type A sorting domain-containing protein [Ginsengibacter hankyongi]|uniref:T9SS type A sorting domain-containing protein n=1 Tax=Ginsengibacter hankyongi TaxID=2607284 RepID=A0A5J5IAJ5_9BACT|nr:T9SS type A sorting domain-containing protein [Ginsengibacter hankyongi]KAA9034435.1 T9SS type A sorting domain-containing protein [Ginsengibacter hankyongi]